MKKPPLSNDILCDITKCSVIIRVNLRNPAIDYLPASQMLFLIAILRRLTQIINPLRTFCTSAGGYKKCSVIIRVNLRNPAIENIISAMENNLLYYFFLGGL